MIKWIYLEFNLAAQTITNPKVIHWRVYKIKSDQTDESAATYNGIQKSQTIKRGMEMLPSDVATVFKRIVLVNIPKGMQRMQQGSSLKIELRSSSSETMNACGFAIFKEYT